MVDEFIKIDKDNYEKNGVVERINLPQHNERKALLVKIRAITKEERNEIVNFDRMQHHAKDYNALIDDEIAKIDSDLAECAKVK